MRTLSQVSQLTKSLRVDQEAARSFLIAAPPAIRSVPTAVALARFQLIVLRKGLRAGSYVRGGTGGLGERRGPS